MSLDQPYRFAITTGWLAHALKSAHRQDHAHLRSTFERLLPADGIAIDVGAHGGQVTRLLAAIASRGHVYAIEPSGYARSILRLALWTRRVSNVSVIASALGAAPGVVSLRTPLKGSGDMGYGLTHVAADPATRPSVVEPTVLTTLDHLVDALSLPRLDFIKADIEGYEAAMIEGAVRTLQRYRPALLLEQDRNHLARAGASLDALWRRLLELGFVPHSPESGAAITGAPREGDVLWQPQI